MDLGPFLLCSLVSPSACRHLRESLQTSQITVGYDLVLRLRGLSSGGRDAGPDTENPGGSGSWDLTHISKGAQGSSLAKLKSQRTPWRKGWYKNIG